MKVNKKALSILVEDEKTALGLQLGLQKSSWEAGEIMDKSHYKYLEIKYRAEKFLRMFTEHIELYEEVIPKYVNGNKEVIDYLKQCIEKRTKPAQVIDNIARTYVEVGFSKSVFNQKLITQLNKWLKSGDPYEEAVYNLIKEFDRWNNYRILPKEVQEPSAFKRRIKNTYKKHIRVLTSIPKLSLQKLKELAETKSSNGVYLPIIFENQIQVIKVKQNRNTLQIFNEITLYIFKDKKIAKDYITSVYHYVNRGKRDCKGVLDFWKDYREYIKSAINYNDVQKITPFRKYLEIAFHKLEFV